MNKKENELYDKKLWKHTNPTDTLIKALKDVDFDKNGVMLSIGANDCETEKELSERFTNNELIIATDVRGYDSNYIVNDHLFVLKDKIDAEIFTIDDFNKYFDNENYNYKHGKPQVIYDRLSALWYSLYKGKTHITKKILDNYISLLDDNGYLITDSYEDSYFINFIHSIYDCCICKKYQKSTYELFKYYVDIDLYIDKIIEIDRDKMNHLMIISRCNLINLSNTIERVNKISSPLIEELFVWLKYSLIMFFFIALIISFLIICIINNDDADESLKYSTIIYFVFAVLILPSAYKALYKVMRET